MGRSACKHAHSNEIYLHNQIYSTCPLTAYIHSTIIADGFLSRVPKTKSHSASAQSDQHLCYATVMV